jgi:adenosylhomocysteine nucleosidase
LTVVGIVAALAAEARALGLLHDHSSGLKALKDGSLLALSGIGSDAATRGAEALVAAGATALASWGMAGGLDPALGAGTIFLPAEIISGAGGVLPTAEPWRERLRAALAGHRPLASGKLLTSAHAIAAVDGKAAAFAQTGAAAVDMESFAVAQVAARHGLPFMAVRVIVDTAHDALPASVVAASRGGQVQMGRLIGSLAMAPGDLPKLLRLAQRYRAATRALAVVGRSGLHAPPAVAVAPGLTAALAVAAAVGVRIS